MLLCNDYSFTCGFLLLNQIVINKILKRRMSEKLVTRQEHHEDIGALNTLRIICSHRDPVPQYSKSKGACDAPNAHGRPDRHDDRLHNPP